MLDDIASVLEKLGISIERTVTVGRYAVLKVKLSSSREAIAKIPRQCIESPSSKECKEESRYLEVEAEHLLRIRSNNITEFIDLVDVGSAKVLIRDYAEIMLTQL